MISPNAQYAFSKLMDKGYSPIQAAALVGNLVHESGVNPVVKPGDGGLSHGIAQWNGPRLAGLQQFASNNSGDWQSLDTQIDYLDHELNNSEKQAGQALRGASDIDAATQAAIGYERPAGWTPNTPTAGLGYDQRLANARQLLDAHNPYAELSDDALLAAAKEQGINVSGADYGNLSDEQLLAEAKNQGILPKENVKSAEQPVSAYKDVAKTVGSNLLGGAADVVMTLPNLLNQAVAGPQLLGRAVADNVSALAGYQPEPRGELWQPFFGSGDVEKALGTAYTPQTTAGKIAELPSRIVGGLVGAKGVDKTNSALTSYGNKAPTLAADEIKTLSRQYYADADANGGILKPNITDKFIDSVDSLRPQTPVGKALAGDEPVAKLSADLQQFRGKPLTLQSAQEIDEILGNKIDNFVDRATGKLSKEGQKLLEAQTRFRAAIDGATPNDMVGGVTKGFESWKQGKQLWAAQTRARDVEKIIERASYMENPVTGLKTGFRNLALKLKNNSMGYTKEEIKAINHAAKTGLVTGGLKIMGSRLISSVTGLGAGAVGGGPVGAVIGTAAGAAAGTPFREAANALQMRRANNVLSKISNRPAVQSAAGFVPKSRANANSYLGTYRPQGGAPMLPGYLASFDQRERNRKEK